MTDLERVPPGKLIATLFSISMRAIQRIYQRSKENMKDELTDVSHRRTRNCSHKSVEINWENFQNIPLREIKIIRDATHVVHVNTLVLYINIKIGRIGRHLSANKPYLSEENKKKYTTILYIFTWKRKFAT